MRGCLPVIAVTLGLVSGLGLVPAAAEGGPPPMDPRPMSGIPRPDPAVESGTVTVRCLLGSFSEPAVGVAVTLELTGPDGSKTDTRKAVTQEQGRATFRDLAEFTGGKAVARATLEGEGVVSQPIGLQADVGSRVMLVTGAGSPSFPSSPPPSASSPAPPGQAGPGVHGDAGNIPRPGKAFAIGDHAPGTLIVGTLDLGDKGRAAGIEVKLTVTIPDGTSSVRTGVSDETGRVVFKDLRPPAIPEGSKIVAEAQISKDGELQRSEAFEMDPASAMAVYLAEGFERVEKEMAARPPGPKQRAPPPGPRSDSALAAGAVAVRVVDGNDQPVRDQPVEVWKKDVAGNDVKYPGTTGPDGIARVRNVAIQGDAFYFVGVAYQGAPYQSGFFELNDRTGVRVDIRVFPTTADVTRVRSAVQFDVRPRENDTAQVSQIYQVFIKGDKAFWPADGRLRIGGPEDTKGLVVLKVAQRWLEEKEGAPFATLAGPIPPEELVNLSVAYLLPHDGELELSWSPPFPVVEASLLLPEDLRLARPNVSPTEPKHETQEPVRFYALGERPAGGSVDLVVADLPVRPRVFRYVAWGLGLLVGFGTWLAVWRRPRQTERDRLEARRQQLERELGSTHGAARDRVVVALDDVFRRLDALAGSSAEA